MQIKYIYIVTQFGQSLLLIMTSWPPDQYCKENLEFLGQSGPWREHVRTDSRLNREELQVFIHAVVNTNWTE